jgi:uncharacterized membrane protein
MALIGRLHPLLIHFPIALVIAAAVAELVAIVTADERCHTVAVANVRAAAIFALLAAITGWRLALTPELNGSALLEWHRWLGALTAATTLAAALATAGGRRRSPLGVLTYRTALFAAGTLVAATGHFGGLLVWGADFLRP